MFATIEPVSVAQAGKKPWEQSSVLRGSHPRTEGRPPPSPEAAGGAASGLLHRPLSGVSIVSVCSSVVWASLLGAYGSASPHPPLASGSVVRPGPDHAPATAPGQLAVVPVEEEQGEGAHDQEEQHPHSEARVVFDGLSDIFIALLDVLSCPYD